jgi:multiple sugar transport system permease protein
MTESKQPTPTAFSRAVTVVLSLVLIVVLLPMFWMIITAFKTKGTAFQLAFLPETELVDPPREVSPRAIPIVAKDALAIHLERNAPSATSVEAVVTQGTTIETLRLDLGFNGVWSGVLIAEKLVAGEASIAYRVNDSDVPPTAVTLSSGLNGAAEGGFVVHSDGANATVRIADLQPAHSNSIELANGARFPLTVDAKGVGSATFAAAGEQTFRVVKERPFGEALAARYTLENFAAILTSKDFNFARYFFNSLVVATAAGFLTVLLCTLAGYAFAQFEFHFRDALFGLLLGSMLVPGMIFMVPQFSITLSLGLMDSYAGMVVPHLANVFGLFLMRQYIGQIPKDLFAAAEIDGAKQHQIFQTIVIPICLPIMVTLFLLTFVGQWSNFLWQLIINTGQSEVLTLPVGLQQFKGQNSNEWEKIMAGACFSILPIAVLFLATQKYFMQGLTAGAVKE